MKDDLRAKTATAFRWSILQSWSVKFLSLLLFFVLARYLDQSQMGLAQSVTVLLAFVAVLSEQGFHSALVQRQGLQSEDINVPFFMATTVACIASVIMYLFAEQIALLLQSPYAVNLIRVASVIPPITAANGFVIAMLRRELNFKSIATASFLASLISGWMAIALVMYGWGPIALVIQAVVSGLITSIIVWTRPGWRPTTHLATRHFKGILAFSSATFAGQLIDFFSGRLIDFIILARYGIAALGVYAVGAKLYLTLLELLATGLTVVAMSSMAKLLGDHAQLKITYLRFIYLAACITMPLFVGIASLSPEICLILFGEKWTKAAEVTHWLSLLGAVQVVQFFNGAVLDATGNPRATLTINLAKLGTGLAALALYPATSIKELTLAFVIAQLCVAPLSFGLAMRVSETKVRDLFRQLAPGLAAACGAYFAVSVARDHLGIQQLALWPLATLLGSLFALTYAATLSAMSGRKVVREFRSVFNINPKLGLGQGK